MATWVAAQARTGDLPVAELMVNRRQADPIERHALSALRAGQVTESQQLRDDAGWEHHFADRDGALDAMAAAVRADIDLHGAGRVAALTVSHADSEALADRIRTDRDGQGFLAGPAIEGPGWAGPRQYRAGDRILLHTHAWLDEGTRLTNGTVATVTSVSEAGLTVTADGATGPVRLPAEFVTGRGADGRPQISHAWARTIDGVQGGTWDQVHLLATPALDRYRGYVGQSRSIEPTHTWNTTPQLVADDGDRGGRLVAPSGTPAEQIAAALARAQPKTFAAVDDPYHHERQVRAEQAEHQAHLDQRPPNVDDARRRAEQTVAARRRDLEDAQARLAQWQTQHERTAGVRGITPNRRRQHLDAGRHVEDQAGAVARETVRLDTARADHDDLLGRQAEGVAFDRANQWRHDRISSLDHQLRLDWAGAVLDAARDGYPAAYGTGRLRAARQTIIDQIEAIAEGTTPGDPHLGATGDDPVRALADLDRAINQIAVRPVRPLRTALQPPAGPTAAGRPDRQYQHQPSQEPPAAQTSVGIDL